jgi:repressor LexA
VKPLTKRQAEVLAWIVRFMDEKRYSPSFEEIGEGQRLKSLCSVSNYLRRLEDKGYIRRARSQSRSIEVIALPQTSGQKVRGPVPILLPVIGTIGGGRLTAIERTSWLFLSKREGIGVAQE